MDAQQQPKQYTEEEAKAALTLLFLAGSLDASQLEPEGIPRDHHIDTPSPSDTTDDLIIDESVALEDQEEEDTLTLPLPPAPAAEEGASEEENEELTGFLANYTMESLVGRMTRVALSSVDDDNDSSHREESSLRQRLEQFINEEEVHGSKYHASMKRVYASAVDRPVSQQINRDKNNTASRLSRIRLRNAEQNLRIEAQRLDEANMARRMKKAILLNYARSLHDTLQLRPMDFNRPVKEILMEYGVDWGKVKGQ